MQTSTTQSVPLPVAKTTISSHPWLMLISRPLLFLAFQLLITLIIALTGTTSAWDESTRWWTFIAFLANFVSIYLLVRLFHAEGKRYFEVIRFSNATWKADLIWFILASIVAMPIMAAPREP